MGPEIYIAGIGAITAIGNNVAQCLSSFENEKAGMGDIAYLDTLHRHKMPVAEVKLSNKQLAEITGISTTISRTTLLGLIAAKEALSDAFMDDFSSLRTGFVSANTVGGMDKSEDFFKDFVSDHRKGKLRN